MKKNFLLASLLLLVLLCALTSCEHEHKWSEWAQVKAVSCTEGNVEERSCRRCDEKETRSTENALGHQYGDWVTIKEATCTEDGEQERICECGEKESRSIQAHGHTEVIDEAVAPTCSETGLTEGAHCLVCNTVIAAQSQINKIEHQYLEILPQTSCVGEAIVYQCTQCDDNYSKPLEAISATLEVCYWSYYENQTFVQDVIRFKGINGGYGEYTINISYTSIAGESFSYSYNGTNDFFETVFLGDCSWNVGFMGASPKASASVCIKDQLGLETTYLIRFPGLGTYSYRGNVNAYSSDVNIDIQTNTIGHAGGEWIIDDYATCDMDGSKHLICSNCLRTETEIIPKLGHNLVSLISAQKDDMSFYSIWACDRCNNTCAQKYDPITASISTRSLIPGASGWDISWQVNSIGGATDSHQYLFIVTDMYTNSVLYATQLQYSNVLTWPSNINSSSTNIEVYVYITDGVGAVEYVFSMSGLWQIDEIYTKSEYSIR